MVIAKKNCPKNHPSAGFLAITQNQFFERQGPFSQIRSHIMMIKFLGFVVTMFGQNFCTNFIEFVIFLYFFCWCFNNCLSNFNDSFYRYCTLQSMTLFSPSFRHELLLNNLNDIHGKPTQLVVTARLPKCVSTCSRVLCIYLGGLSSTINIPLVVYFIYGSTANF